MHYYGFGTEYSCLKAARHFHVVALRGVFEGLSGPLQYLSLSNAITLYNDRDFRRAAVQFAILSQLGSDVAMCNLAFTLESASMPYRRGFDPNSLSTAPFTGVSRIQIHSLYREAAFYNNSIALRKMGDCAREGWEGVCHVNLTEATANYSTGAEKGDAEAMYNAAQLYWSINASISIRYLRQCAEMTYPHSFPCRAQLTVTEWMGYPRQIVESLYKFWKY